MRNFIAFLLLVIFTFGCAKTSGMFTKDESSIPDTNQVVSQEFDIATVTTDTVGDKIVQVVHLKDGKEMIFSDAYMGINDLDLRINYITYKNMEEYQSIKDSLRRQSPSMQSNLLDMMCFNKFLENQGLTIISYDEYNKKIAEKIDESKITTAFILISLAVFFCLVTFGFIAIAASRFFNRFNSFLADENKYLYIGRRNSA